MRFRAVGLCCLGMLSVPTSYSAIAHVSLEELVQSSDQIVIANVTEVVETQDGASTVKHATAMVEKTLKGQPLRSIRFVAFTKSENFMCGTDDAIVGESVLLFLYKNHDEEFGIGLAGRGRMPLRKVGVTTYATLWSEVVLPQNAPVIPGPDAEYDFIVSVELAYLEREIVARGKESFVARSNKR